jgi:hypothetical protein
MNFPSHSNAPPIVEKQKRKIKMKADPRTRSLFFIKASQIGRSPIVLPIAVWALLL